MLAQLHSTVNLSFLFDIRGPGNTHKTKTISNFSLQIVETLSQSSDREEKKKWKEVVSDLKTFAHKGCKITAHKKSFFFWRIC